MPNHAFAQKLRSITAKNEKNMRFLQLWIAYFLRFIAANLSLTQFVTWAKPLKRVYLIECFSFASANTRSIVSFLSVYIALYFGVHRFYLMSFLFSCFQHLSSPYLLYRISMKKPSISAWLFRQSVRHTSYTGVPLLYRRYNLRAVSCTRRKINSFEHTRSNRQRNRRKGLQGYSVLPLSVVCTRCVRFFRLKFRNIVSCDTGGS